jgi:hypothetical protein
MTIEREVMAANVRVVRAGHGANCSSIGSVIDTLFATATAGAVAFAAVLAALKRENVKVVGHEAKPAAAEPPAETQEPT